MSASHTGSCTSDRFSKRVLGQKTGRKRAGSAHKRLPPLPACSLFTILLREFFRHLYGGRAWRQAGRSLLKLSSIIDSNKSHRPPSGWDMAKDLSGLGIGRKGELDPGHGTCCHLQGLGGVCRNSRSDGASAWLTTEQKEEVNTSTNALVQLSVC
eukprot:4581132-Amphidinium_carterae.2